MTVVPKVFVKEGPLAILYFIIVYHELQEHIGVYTDSGKENGN